MKLALHLVPTIAVNSQKIQHIVKSRMQFAKNTIKIKKMGGLIGMKRKNREKYIKIITCLQIPAALILGMETGEGAGLKI